MTARRAPVLLVLAVTAAGLIAPAPAHADSVRSRQWHLAALDVLQAQRLSQGEGVIVAVADTGVDDRHPELAGAVMPGKEFGEGASGEGKDDTDGHGTAMAGLIAGRGLPNDSGVLGIAPKAMILPVQTVHSEFGGSPTNLAAGIDWATAHGAKIICIAAVTSEYPVVKNAVEAAIRADVVVVAGTGNAPATARVGFPAKIPGVLAVGGTDRDGTHATISATGPEVVLSAPATDIISLDVFGKYGTGDGTSNSTAIVAGVVALVRAKYPHLPAAEVVRRLTATATDRGKPGRDDEYGYGIVNPVAALTATLPADPSSAGQPAGQPSSAGQPAGQPSAGQRQQRGAVSPGWLVVGAGVVAGTVVWWLRRRTR